MTDIQVHLTRVGNLISGTCSLLFDYHNDERDSAKLS